MPSDAATIQYYLAQIASDYVYFYNDYIVMMFGISASPLFQGSPLFTRMEKGVQEQSHQRS